MSVAKTINLLQKNIIVRTVMWQWGVSKLIHYVSLQNFICSGEIKEQNMENKRFKGKSLLIVMSLVQSVIYLPCKVLWWSLRSPRNCKALSNDGKFCWRIRNELRNECLKSSACSELMDVWTATAVILACYTFLEVGYARRFNWKLRKIDSTIECLQHSCDWKYSVATGNEGWPNSESSNTFYGLGNVVMRLLGNMKSQTVHDSCSQEWVTPRDLDFHC